MVLEGISWKIPRGGPWKFRGEISEKKNFLKEFLGKIRKKIPLKFVMAILGHKFFQGFIQDFIFPKNL